MTIPAAVAAELARALGPLGAATPLSGGCISAAYRVAAGGRNLFVKFEPDAPAGFFEAEAAGLAVLKGEAKLLRIPEVVGKGPAEAGPSWIALEWLDPATPDDRFWSTLGTGLAALHRVTHTGWGYERDGFIGRLPQRNETLPEWPDFWWSRRLGPQLTLAFDSGRLAPGAEWDRLQEALPIVLDDARHDGPSTLHGDLWSGNVIATRNGPALIDPASYRGHREVDLAMTELFGGFDPAFYDAYSVEWPLRPGSRRRRAVYQLYYLLVHVNLFGPSYLARTRDTLGQVLAAT